MVLFAVGPRPPHDGANEKTGDLQESADLVLEITLHLDEQCAACQQCTHRVTVEALKRTSLYQPHCMMRAMPTASLRSLLLICIESAALAWRASMQIVGKPSAVSSVHSQSEVGPASMPMRTAPGAFNVRNRAISSGYELTVASLSTLPARSTTQMDVRFNEMSRPT